jgi:hypothetical protein
MAPPPKPSPPGITTAAAHALTVGWQPDSSATAYRVRAYDSAGAATETRAAVPPVTIDGLYGNERYRVTLEAENADGASAESDATTVWTGLPQPAVPPILFASPRDKGVVVGWDLTADTARTRHLENVSVQVGRRQPTLPGDLQVIGVGRLRGIFFDLAAPVGELLYAVRLCADNPENGQPVFSPWSAEGAVVRTTQDVAPGGGGGGAPAEGGRLGFAVARASSRRDVAEEDSSGDDRPDGDDDADEEEPEHREEGDRPDRTGRPDIGVGRPPDDSAVDPERVRVDDGMAGEPVKTGIEERDGYLRLVEYDGERWQPRDTFVSREEFAVFRERPVGVLFARIDQGRAGPPDEAVPLAGGRSQSTGRLNYFDRPERSRPEPGSARGKDALKDGLARNRFGAPPGRGFGAPPARGRDPWGLADIAPAPSLAERLALQLPSGAVAWVADTSSGFADYVTGTFTWGLWSTADYRRSHGLEGFVKTDSKAYRAGTITGGVWQVAFSWTGGLSGGARSVFYSGGRGAEAAKMGRTIGKTLLGRVFNKVDAAAGKVLGRPRAERVMRPVWIAASATFALNAKGVAIKVGRIVPDKSIWKIEKQILDSSFLKKAIPVRYILD